MWPHCFGTLVRVSAGHIRLHMDLSACRGLRSQPMLRRKQEVFSWCLFEVKPLLNPQGWSMTEELVFFASAGVLSWGNKWSRSSCWALVCGKHVSGLCVISLQIIDSSVAVSVSWADSAEEGGSSCLVLTIIELKSQSSTELESIRSGLWWVPEAWEGMSLSGLLGRLTPDTSSSLLPKSLGEEIHLSPIYSIFHSNFSMLTYFYFLYSFRIFSLSLDTIPRWD